MNSSTERHTSSPLRLIPAILLGLSFVISAVGPANAEQNHSVEMVDPDPIGTDAIEVAKDAGITVAEAREAIERQPRLGLLARALEEHGPAAFGGIFVDYGPEYAITLMAQPGQGQGVADSVSNLGFRDLMGYVKVNETPYSEDALDRAITHVGGLSRGRATTLAADIRTGEVLVTGATQADVESIRNAVASSQKPIEARRVLVTIGEDHPEHSMGGLALSSCTAGFSVRSTSGDGLEGVSTAGHCANLQSIQEHHGGTPLEYVSGREKVADSSDIQFHKTPGLTDPNLVQVSGSGMTREITSRTDRSEMVVGGAVCHYGKTTGFGCGVIEFKNHDPDGSGSFWHATWIRVGEDDTADGDSGGPWLLGSAAYGTHRGSTSSGDKPYFMASNYMSSVNISVRINP